MPMWTDHRKRKKGADFSRQAGQMEPSLWLFRNNCSIGNYATAITENQSRSAATLGDTLAKRPHKTVLFLCTGNYFRSRFAEILFNYAAGEIGLAWKASSRALAPEPATRNVGPMAVVAIQALEGMGIRASADFARLPLEVTTDELDQAHLIVALKQTEHLPMLQERFPAWVEKVEFWEVDDDPKVLGLIEKELADLIARLIVGGKRGDSPVQPWKAWAIRVKRVGG